MGRKMSNAPIFYTVAQIRFSPVLDMAKYVNEIQDRLRGSFPEFRAEKRQTVQLGNVGEAAELKSEANVRWHFVDASNGSGFILEQGSLIFHTTAYETSGLFFDRLLQGLDVVHSAASLGYIQRIGVRTLDAIVPEEDEDIGVYVQRETLGFSRLLSGELKHNISEAMFSIGSGMLIARLIITKGSLALPADLFPIVLNLTPRLQNLDAFHAVLDIDRSDEYKMPVNTSEVRRCLQMIKRDVTDAFEKTVTPDALQRWR